MHRWLHDTAHRLANRADSASVTRRGLLHRFAEAAGIGAVALGTARGDLVAKKRKKNRDKPPKPSDFFGTWSTRLSNGVQGVATFSKDEWGLCCDGSYRNSRGSGTFTCTTPLNGDAEAGCIYSQQSDGTSGSFHIKLTDEDHWKGWYQVDGGDRGTWSGTRR